MDHNPFVSVIQSIRNDKKIPESYRIGTIISPNPLAVEIAGINQGTDALLKSDTLTSFEIGDRLLLIPIEDEQRYIIICKVVEA